MVLACYWKQTALHGYGMYYTEDKRYDCHSLRKYNTKLQSS
jgi:hypothetical protein